MNTVKNENGQMILGKSMPFEAGVLAAQVFGGPFVRYIPGQRRLVGVKLAAEIDAKCEVSIPTEDFQVPDVNDMRKGINVALRYISQGNDIYAGCMGGIGRTGLFMGCMAKVMQDYQKETKQLTQHRVDDPVKYVRKHYRHDAMETELQQDYARTFDTSSALSTIIDLPAITMRDYDDLQQMMKNVRKECDELQRAVASAKMSATEFDTLEKGSLFKRLAWALSPKRGAG